MGNGTSDRSREKDREISRNLAKQKKDEGKTIKLLLLGPGGSGKSTILKQMRMLHHKEYTNEELNMFKVIIYSNILKSMETIIRAMHTVLNTSFKDPAREEDSMEVFESIKFGRDGEPLTAKLAASLKRLWEDANVKKAFALRNQFQVIDSAQHFLDSIGRIAAPDYEPSSDDILHARSKTTGIIEIKFTVNDFIVRVIDMGGQRSERRKWIQCFEDVQGIIFIVAVSEYDQVLEEDESANRMLEALQLFKWICNMLCFNKTSIILFLNKIDIFRKKIKESSISAIFPKFDGKNEYDDCILFIKQEFELLSGVHQHSRTDEERQIYVHETCATDTEQVQTIIRNTIDITIRNNMHMIGLA